ncbi:hypothetical protein H5410_002775 [Solanum commersonii]|uniref:Uncharacterized protein n=1 Tax=Solanum commersonii TaxID=4109 RepID=A0A9J6B399_SOLCO|nr:hypothetical protein H5410_002775 [Solanum commersonii]
MDKERSLFTSSFFQRKGMLKGCSKVVHTLIGLVITICKEFTYCLCNFIWPHRRHTFMFVRLIALFKSSSEESRRPKSKFLELKPFESSCCSKPSPNIELKILSDHSVLLVEIANQLDDLTFGTFHHHLALSFNIVMAQHIGTKGEVKTFWRLVEWVRQLSGLHFVILSAAFVTFC